MFWICQTLSCYLKLIILFSINHFLHTFKWFQALLFSISNSIYQVFLSNTNNLYAAVWFKVTIITSKRLNSSIWPIDGTLTGTSSPNQSGPESNSHEGVLHILQILRVEPHHLMRISVILRTTNGFKYCNTSNSI